jgi:hypothetical protein
MEDCDIHLAPPAVPIFTLSVFALHALLINEKRAIEKTLLEDQFDIDRSFDLSVLPSFESE